MAQQAACRTPVKRPQWGNCDAVRRSMGHAEHSGLDEAVAPHCCACRHAQELANGHWERREGAV